MLVVIESPTKISKIKAVLPRAEVLATGGHFRELPKTEFGITLSTYLPEFGMNPEKAARIRQIRHAAYNQDVVIATDPDREGYAIGTHVAHEVAQLAKGVYRVEIRELTREGISEAFNNAVPWEKTNRGEYDAFLGRRVADRLTGYLLSPLASAALGTPTSVGRVQSAAVKLCVDREREIETFTPTSTWALNLSLEKGIGFQASCTFADPSSADAALVTVAGQETATVVGVVVREEVIPPPLPFSTVELQAAASAVLGIAPEETMALAQDIFEGGSGDGSGSISEGLISYHRTASAGISRGAAREVRGFVSRTFGAAYTAKTESVSPNGAHEGIRPTRLHHFEEIPSIVAAAGLSPRHAQLYALIYRRIIASEMAPAVYATTTIELDCGGVRVVATTRVRKFAGHEAAYREALKETPQELPLLQAGEVVPKLSEELHEVRTAPPARYTEATLVKALAENSIGRPSTYAPIIATIKNRGYVDVQGGEIHITPAGEKLVAYLAAEHPWVIDLDLTRRMEEYLDQVDAGTGRWQSFVRGVHAKMGYATPAPRAEDHEPTAKALRFGQDLAGRHQVELPAECLTSSFALTRWINEILGKGNGRGSKKRSLKIDPTKPFFEANREKQTAAPRQAA